MNFFVFDHRDTAYPFRKALLDNGFTEVENYKRCDFVFMDWDKEKYKDDIAWLEQHNKKIFIYPHSPIHSCIAWDVYPYIAKVACNFVTGVGQEMVLNSYGYPYPVEVVGWAYTPIQPIHIVTNHPIKVLYAPLHPNTHGNGNYIWQKDKEANQQALELLATLHYSRAIELTVRYGHSLERSGLTMPKHYGKAGHINCLQSEYTHASCIRAIEKHDVIVANQTFGFLSVALGKPTVMYDTETPYHTIGGTPAKHWNVYKSKIQFPLDLFKGSAWEIICDSIVYNTNVSVWKHRFVGFPFNSKFFVEKVKEYMK